MFAAPQMTSGQDCEQNRQLFGVQAKHVQSQDTAVMPSLVLSRLCVSSHIKALSSNRLSNNQTHSKLVKVDQRADKAQQNETLPPQKEHHGIWPVKVVLYCILMHSERYINNLCSQMLAYRLQGW